MSELVIRFDANSGWAGQAAVPVEIIDATHRPLSHRPLLKLGSEVRVTVIPGTYLVRAFLPSGEILSEQVTLATAAAKEVSLLRPQTPSPSEAFAWAYYLQRPRNKIAPLSVEAARGVPKLWSNRPNYTFWRHEPNEWIVVRPENADYPRPSQNCAEGSSDPRALGQLSWGVHLAPLWLQASGHGYPSRFVALPPSVQTDVFFFVDGEPGQDPDPLNVQVRSGNPRAQALINYLQQGAFAQARLIAEATNDEDWLFDTLIEPESNDRLRMALEADPAAAAIVAYYALRAAPRTWTDLFPSILAHFSSWMPDGLVLHAWNLLRRDHDQVDNEKFARQRLLETERCGLPLFTQGLRLLLDGLNLFYHRSQGKDQDVEQALDRLQPYALATEWQAITTTFYGDDPARPKHLTP